MMVAYEKNTWPLWQCLRPEALSHLARLQRKKYRKGLNLPDDPYRDVESLEEIDRLMRKPSHYREVQW